MRLVPLVFWGVFGLADLTTVYLPWAVAYRVSLLDGFRVLLKRPGATLLLWLSHSIVLAVPLTLGWRRFETLIEPPAYPLQYVVVTGCIVVLDAAIAPWFLGRRQRILLSTLPPAEADEAQG